MKPHLLAVLAPALAAVFGSPARGADLECPPEVIPRTAPASAPEGWRIVPDDAPREFTSLQLFSGPPEELASLVPDRDDAAGLLWRLDPGATHWVACRYRDVPTALTRPLPAGVKECRAVKEAVGPRVKRPGRRLACR